MKIEDFKVEIEILKKEMNLHHFALARGYRKVNNYNILKYDGRYGKGYIVEYPTKESSCSNSYHRIAYFIYK